MGRGDKWIPAMAGAIALLYGFWILHHGVQSGPDVRRFSEWGDTLLAHRFDFIEYLRQVRHTAPPVLYLGWIYVVAIAKFIAAGKWPLVIVALNWAAVVGVAIMVLNTVWRLTSSSVAVFAAGALLVNFDLLTFAGFPLSDVLFLLIATAVLTMAVRIAEQPTAGRRIGGTALLLFACIFRPAAAPLVVLWGVALLWPFLGARFRRWLPAVTALSIIAALLLLAALLSQGAFPTLKHFYDQGTIICGREETWVSPPSQYGDYAVMVLGRWAYFFAVVLRGYSAAHNIGNLLYFTPAYALALLSLLLRPNDRRRAAALTLFTVLVLVTSAFHGAIGIDFDHRYRLAIVPALIMLAACGACEVARRLPAVKETALSIVREYVGQHAGESVRGR